MTQNVIWWLTLYAPIYILRFINTKEIGHIHIIKRIQKNPYLLLYFISAREMTGISFQISRLIDYRINERHQTKNLIKCPFVYQILRNQFNDMKTMSNILLSMENLT